MIFYLECVLHVIGLFVWYVLRQSCPRQVLFLYSGCGVILHTMHRLGHDPSFWRKWFIAHTFGHHQQAYPSNKFTSSDGYVKNNHDKWNLNVATYVVASLAFLLTCWTIFNSETWQMLTDLIAITLFLLLENSIHNAIHFPTPWMQIRKRFPPLDDLISRAHDRHLLHHQHKRIHYAMVAWWFDWSMNTYNL